jgi:membrane protease YdiL (CAAX protease family)
LTIVLAVLIGLGVLVAAGRLVLAARGRDPLGREPEGDLPDTRRALVLGLLLWLTADLAAIAILQGPGGEKPDTPLAALVVVGSNLGVSVILLRFALAGTRRPTVGAGRLLATGVLGGIVAFAAAGGVGAGIQAIYKAAGIPVPQQDLVLSMQAAHGTDLLVLLLCAVVLAPVSEEIFFRGILLPAAARMMGRKRALIVQALLFGAVHCVGAWRVWPLAVPLAVVGLVCGWLYVRTGSLAVAVAAHFTFNAVNVALIRAS